MGCTIWERKYEPQCHIWCCCVFIQCNCVFEIQGWYIIFISHTNSIAPWRLVHFAYLYHVDSFLKHPSELFSSVIVIGHWPVCPCLQLSGQGMTLRGLELERAGRRNGRAFWPSSCIGLMVAWWRYQMEVFPALLFLCAGNSPHKGPVKRTLMFLWFGSV